MVQLLVRDRLISSQLKSRGHEWEMNAEISHLAWEAAPFTYSHTIDTLLSNLNPEFHKSVWYGVFSAKFIKSVRTVYLSLYTGDYRTLCGEIMRYTYSRELISLNFSLLSCPLVPKENNIYSQYFIQNSTKIFHGTWFEKTNRKGSHSDHIFSWFSQLINMFQLLHWWYNRSRLNKNKARHSFKKA